jgi:hypothetical protein
MSDLPRSRQGPNTRSAGSVDCVLECPARGYRTRRHKHPAGYVEGSTLLDATQRGQQLDGFDLADTTTGEMRKQIFFQIALLADGVVVAPARMVLLVPLKRRLAKGVAGATAALSLTTWRAWIGLMPDAFCDLAASRALRAAARVRPG